VAGRSPLGVAPWRSSLGQASSARWPAAAAPQRDRIGEGREERGGERRALSVFYRLPTEGYTQGGKFR
jgi:hypothetical protein